MEHPREDLIASVTGELPDAARVRLAAHLDRCPACRDEHAAYVRILGSLREAMPEPPALDWGRYRADLRARLDGSRVSWWSWWSRPVPLALSATLAGVLLALTWLTQPGTPGRPELQAAEEATLGRRVGLLRDWPVVERLDLLENFDVITQLDDLESEG